MPFVRPDHSPALGRIRRPLACAGPRVEIIGHFDIDFERRYGRAAVQPDRDLLGIELDVPRDHGENLLAQRRQQVRLTAQAALVRQQNLQPFPRHRGGCLAAAEQPQQIHAHAALRPSNRFIKPLRSAGTTMSTVSPISRRAASI